MALQKQSLGGMYEGISQQAPSLRRPNQCESQVNSYNSVVHGSKKRNPADYLSDVGIFTPDIHFHTINRDKDERYMVALANGTLGVFDAEDGDQKTVIIEDNSLNYLVCNSPSEDLQAITVADYTFIVNRTKVVEALEADPYGDSGQVASYQYYKFSQTKVNTSEIEYVTWKYNGSNAFDHSSVPYVMGHTAGTTSSVPEDALSQGSASNHWTVNYGNEGTYWLMIDLDSNPDVDEFVISGNLDNDGNVILEGSNDGNTWNLLLLTAAQDGVNSYSIGGSVSIGRQQTFEDLMLNVKSPSVGDIYEITGDDVSKFDSFYVIRTSNDVWEETHKPGEQRKLDPSTMPHVLISNADGTFTLREAEWAPRKAGDVFSNPFPSFLNNTIQDIFFHQNRLGMLSGQNVIMSRSSDYFDFFRSTVTALIDTDPIDVAASHTSVVGFLYAVPFNESLILVSRQFQFALNYTEVLSPKTVSIDQLTSYEAARKIRPVNSGESMFMVLDYGPSATMREFHIGNDGKDFAVRDITAHVPNYIPQNLNKMEVAINFNMLFLLPESLTNEIYIYQWKTSGNELVQQAWNKWTFAHNVINIYVLDDYLYVVLMDDDSNSSMARISLVEDGEIPDDAEYNFMMDLRCKPTKTRYLEDGLWKTDFNLPYEDTISDNLILVDSEGGQIEYTKKDSSTLKVDGSYISEYLFAGYAYEHFYQFTRILPRSNESTVLMAKVLLKALFLSVMDTHYFRTDIYRKGYHTPLASATPTSVDFTESQVQGYDYNLGDIHGHTGVVRIPAMGRSSDMDIVLRNSSIFNSTFQTAEWLGVVESNT